MTLFLPSDNTIKTIISTLQTVGIIITAIIGLFNNILGQRNMGHLIETKNNLNKASTQIDNLEKNTNSMKDALIKATGEVEYAKGLKVGTDITQTNKK